MYFRSSTVSWVKGFARYAVEDVSRVGRLYQRGNAGFNDDSVRDVQDISQV